MLKRDQRYLSGLRASDADREHAAELLRDGAVAGRLSIEELGDRLERAYAARTYGELQLLLADLPLVGVAPLPTHPAGVQARSRFGHLTALVVLGALAALLAPTLLWAGFALTMAVWMMMLMIASMAAPFVLVAAAVAWAARRPPSSPQPSSRGASSA